MVRQFRFYDPQHGASSLGKTATRAIQVSGADGTIFRAEVYTCVNVTDNPELRQDLFDGTLNVVTGSDGDVYRPALPVIYHDPKAQIFALIIPEALRHEELRLRAELLDALAEYPDELPAYIHRVHAIFDPDQLSELASAAGPGAEAGPNEATVITEAPTAPSSEEANKLRGQLEKKESEMQAMERARRDLEEELLQLKDELEELKGAADGAAQQGAGGDALEEERRKLAIDREQLEEVASRIERDSARVEEAMTDIQRQRVELEEERNALKEERRKLQVQELNLEQEKLRLKAEGQASFADGDKPYANEATQVVTADQFIEVVDAEESEEGIEAQAVSDSELVADSPAPVRPEPTSVTFVSYESEEIFETFDDVAADGKDYFVEATADLIVAGFRLDEDRALSFLDGESRFLFQLHEVNGTPLIALTLAIFDDEGQCVDAVAAPMADATPQERALLDQLAQDLRLHLAVYDESGERIASWEAGAPIRRNIGWARQRLRQWREEAGDGTAQTAAAARLAAGEVDVVGSMRHPFEAQRFTDFDGASDVKLAVSIVGYWSQPEQFDYLVGNRAFPLETFQKIQKRVVRQALHWGIAPGEALRQVAIDEAIILDNVSLVQRLLSNFAEVCVGLRPNDLDPLEQWENWNTLIEVAQRFNVTPDPDVLELAEVSLKRAEEYDEVFDADDFADNLREGSGERIKAHQGDVTYFLPEGYDHGEEGFDHMMSADLDRLVQLLDDDERRLMAAQALLEKSGAGAVSDVLEASEKMSAVEAEALSKFVEARADGLEASLIQALNGAGSSATLVITRALVSVENAAAMPRLLDAIRDTDKQGDLDALATALAGYGDKLLPPLTRVLKKNPDDPALLAALAALEGVRRGTLDELAGERSKDLQKAADRARQLL